MSPYKLLSTREVYRTPWLRVREDRVTAPDGSDATFSVVESKPGSTVVAIDAAQRVWLIREYKYGVGRECIEAVSGGIEPGESALDAARRELEEEAGVVASDWLELGHVDPFTAVVASPNYLFVARGLAPGRRQLDATEVIHPFQVNFAEAVDMVLRGDITHSASCLAILKAHLAGVCG
ncbi:MAG: NUDIX hydrolase [Bryobacterales bacterium]|jgi:8-oxo-dGTP pyrophosphatase MutT (NUDIX family)|nr:NUDIX hydrolase [Bryobacterales bacterium]